MLNDREEKFLNYWEKNRVREKKIWRQLALGLPIGALFGIALFLNFISGWYKRADMVAHSSFNPWVLVVAIVIIAVFIAIFSKKLQWDRKEQAYRELLIKKNKTHQNQSETNENN